MHLNGGFFKDKSASSYDTKFRSVMLKCLSATK